MKSENIRLKLHIKGLEFLLPYIERELPEAEFVDENYDAFIAIISPEENNYVEFSSDATILICPNIVGTGMSGLPMTIASKIASGTFFHIPGNEARLSTVHAVDVARAARLALKTPGKFVVTDCQNPTYHDFAESLAWRINHKRITTPKPLLAKIALGTKLYKTLTTDNILDGSEFAEKFDFKPTAVTEYLRTHNYDDESL